jgi:hypothetical protein
MKRCAVNSTGTMWGEVGPDLRGRGLGERSGPGSSALRAMRSYPSDLDRCLREIVAVSSFLR